MTVGTRHSALGTRPRRRASVLLLVGAVCGATPAAAQNGSGRVEFERTGYRLTALGVKVSVSAKLVDARRRAVPNAPIAYRVSNPTIAVVSNQGVVQSKRVGRTMVWAVSGTDSASALIVVDQWATTFSFSPPAVLFDAIGARVPLQVQLRDAAGNGIPDLGRRATTQCRSRDERIATLMANGNVLSKAAGTTWVRCTDRGISDSVRVEIRQRPARVMITDKLAIGAKAVSDTFRLRARAFDSKGDSIAAARASWASLERGVVSVDPLSGLARAVGGGTTRIVAQVGDVTDTVTVEVTGAAAVGLAADSVTAVSLTPTLVLDALAPVVAETTTVKFTAKDAGGIDIPGAGRDMAFASSNDSVFRYLGNLRILPRATGQAWLIARLSVGGIVIVESTTVSPRARSTTAASAVSDVVLRPFVRPTFNTDSMTRFNSEQLARKLRDIIDSGSARPKSGRVFSMEGMTGQALHATKTTTVTETRSGLVFGGTGTLAPFRWLVATGSFRTGTLAPKTDDLLTEDMQLTEADAQLALWPTTWFGIGGSYLLRGEKTELSSVAWKGPGVSVMSRGRFVGGTVGTYAAVTLFPATTFSGRPDKPKPSSMGAEAGMELRFKWASAAFTYYVEKFSFTAEGGSGEREDQFSSLRLKVGFKLGS